MWNTIVKPWDLFLTILVSLAIGAISFVVYDTDGQPTALRVKSETGIAIYPLDRNQRFEVAGPLGITVIEIADEQVRVLSSPCRDKLCVIKGVLEHNGDWTACMPNRIYLNIEGGTREDVDDLSY